MNVIFERAIQSLSELIKSEREKKNQSSTA